MSPAEQMLMKSFWKVLAVFFDLILVFRQKQGLGSTSFMFLGSSRSFSSCLRYSSYSCGMLEEGWDGYGFIFRIGDFLHVICEQLAKFRLFHRIFETVVFLGMREGVMKLLLA
jgi:hypothetical protein